VVPLQMVTALSAPAERIGVTAIVKVGVGSQGVFRV
jgi:hypothetical protein